MSKMPAKQMETTESMPGSEVGTYPKFSNRSPLSSLDPLEKRDKRVAENSTLQIQKREGMDFKKKKKNRHQ